MDSYYIFIVNSVRDIMKVVELKTVEGKVRYYLADMLGSCRLWMAWEPLGTSFRRYPKGFFVQRTSFGGKVKNHALRYPEISDRIRL